MKLFKKLVVIFAVLACLYFGVTVLTSSYSQEEEHLFEYRGVAAFSDMYTPYEGTDYAQWRRVDMGEFNIPELPPGATLATHQPHVSIVWDKQLLAGGQNLTALRHAGLNPTTNNVVMWMRWTHNGGTSIQMSDIVSINNWGVTYPADSVVSLENYPRAFARGNESVYWGASNPEGVFPPGETTLEYDSWPLTPGGLVTLELHSLWNAPDWESMGHPWPFRYDIPMEYTVDVTWLPN